MKHLRMSIIGLNFLLLLAGCAAKAPSQTNETPATMAPDHVLLTTDDLTWGNAPAILPAGATVAVLEGDPSKAGPFTLRLKFPAGYKIAPHTHPAIEHVTVLQGSLWLGMGGTFDESVMEQLPAGSFATMQVGTQHFAMTKDGATVQLHGIGPWGLTYVNPADDPREQK